MDSHLMSSLPDWLACWTHCSFLHTGIPFPNPPASSCHGSPIPNTRAACNTYG
jgi:hypothetical protein